jgi:very-short-patch-repair endonuclease
MTKAEVYFWNRVKQSAVRGVKFRRQHSIDEFILDFYAPELKLAVEIDGGYHNLPEVRKYDSRRSKHIETYGITIIRFTNDEVLQDQDATINRLIAVIENLRFKIFSTERHSLRCASPPYQGGG